jgi:flagellar biosynthesis/type III secretory pathway protein FliH
VRSLRGPNIDSDHYLVSARVRARISNASQGIRTNNQKYNTAALESAEVRERYQERLTEILEEVEGCNYIAGISEAIKTAVETAANEVVGKEKRRESSQWFDAECEAVTEEKNKAYRRTLQGNCTRRMKET